MYFSSLSRFVIQKTSSAFLVAVFLYVSCASARAGEILKGVSFVDKGETVEIRAEMGAPFNYVKHFPSGRGKIIQIQIKPVGSEFNDSQLRQRDTIKPGENAPVAVRDVIYEGNVRGGPYLVLRFPVVTSFSLGKEQNSTVLTVEVTKEKLAESVVAPVVEQQVLPENTEADQLMQDGRAALTRGMNTDAILKFTLLLRLPQNKHTQDAKEYLGLARERNGQLDMAKEIYDDYLKLYPETSKSNTVRQRLMTLNARITQMERDLKEGKRQRAQRTGVDIKRDETFGRVSQLVYTAQQKLEDQTAQWGQQRVLSFVDVTRRWRDEDKEARLSFSGTHDADFLNEKSVDVGNGEIKKVRETEYETRVRSAFYEYKGKKKKIQATIGRQSVNSGGVLGRFDGLLAGYEFQKDRKIFAVFGAPVDYQEHQKVQTNKPLVGGRLDIDDLVKDWKGSAYAVQQQVDGILDRRAVGGDLRHFKKDTLFYALVDADVDYKTINFVTGHYGWQMNEKTKLDFHYDKRRSPVMLTSNALKALSSSTDIRVPDNLRSTNASIADLLEVRTEAEIRQMAKDYTGNSWMFTFGATRDLPRDMQFIGNVTGSSYKPGYSENQVDTTDPNLETPVDKRENLETKFIPSDLDWIVSAQLVRRNWFVERDIVLGGLRVSTNDLNKRVSANVTLRRPYDEKWWLDIRGRVLFTRNVDNNNQVNDTVRLSPSMRAEYRQTKKLTFEVELGMDYNKSQAANQDYTWSYLNLGYRYFF